MWNKKSLQAFLIGVFIASLGGVLYAAPVSNVFTNIIPAVTNTYDNGTSTARWKNLYAVSGDFSGTITVAGCTGCTTGGVYPFTPTAHLGSVMSATTSNILVLGGGFYASSTSILSTTTVLGALNIGTLTATSGTSYLNALSLGTALTVPNGGTGNTTFSAGQLLYGSAAGALATVATGTVSGTNGITVTASRAAIGGALAIDCTVASASNAGCLSTTDWTSFNSKALYPFTPTVNLGLTMSATSTNIECLGCGFYASSTSILSTTTVRGALNTGTLTATSGTSYINALSLGTKLANTELANSSITISGSGGITATNCGPVSLGGTCTLTGSGGYPFTPTVNLALTMSATTSNIECLGCGFYASSTSILSTTTVRGSLNVGTLTATSGTSYLNALTLGTDLAVAQGGTGLSTFGGVNTILYTTAADTLSSEAAFTYNPSTNLFIADNGQLSSSTIANLWVNSSATTSKLDVRGSFATTIASSSAGASSPYTVDWSTGSIQRYILNANSFIAINATSSNPQDGGRYTLKVCQDSTGSRTLTFSTPTQLRWWRGTTTIDSTANTCTLIGMIYDGLKQRYNVVASSTGILND